MSCNEKKKVTFDLNVKTFEGLSTEEGVANNVAKNNIGEREGVKTEKKKKKKKKKKKNHQTTSVGAGLGEKEFTSPMPKCGSPPEEELRSGFDRNARVRSQLDDFDRNPVENLTQLMIVAIGRAALTLQHEGKANVNV
ncbi:hypothetical protein NC651_039628 [Populus alba x Populus x berolinensis]|nr:hypothetical protein NC651_039628 [Populus alba x Populus x berolinensis]